MYPILRFLIYKVKVHPFLYRLWILKQSFKKKDRRLPSKRDNFYFDGYPRSGNTYSYGLICSIFKELTGAHHLHVIAGIKIALTNKIPIVIIFRNPENAIVSNLYRKLYQKDTQNNLEKEWLIGSLIQEWIDYYSFALKHKNNIFLIHFVTIIQSPIEVIDRLSLFLKKESPNTDLLNNQILGYKLKIESLESKKEKAHSSLPNIDRTFFKNKNIEQIRNHPKFELATSIYTNLLKYTNI